MCFLICLSRLLCPIVINDQSISYRICDVVCSDDPLPDIDARHLSPRFRRKLLLFSDHSLDGQPEAVRFSCGLGDTAALHPQFTKTTPTSRFSDKRSILV